VRALLEEAVAEQTTARSYDIFLSHAIADVGDYDILGTKALLEDFGFEVYLDWIEDPQLDRETVSSRTARTLRRRMNCCKGLLYTVTPGSRVSRWMQWECGYFDGRKEKVAILPLTRVRLVHYVGVEFLGIYPYVDRSTDDSGKEHLWVNSAPNVYVELREWLSGAAPSRRM